MPFASKERYNEYMRFYMRDYRLAEREAKNNLKKWYYHIFLKLLSWKREALRRIRQLRRWG
jgi:hypothetical protein